MKGKPWSVEEEKQLREMVQEHKRLSEIAGFFGKSPESIKMKIRRLKLVVVVRQIQHTTTSNKQRKKRVLFLFMPYKWFYVLQAPSQTPSTSISANVAGASSLQYSVAVTSTEHHWDHTLIPVKTQEHQTS